jgi:hypothetical protein
MKNIKILTSILRVLVKQLNTIYILLLKNINNVYFIYLWISFMRCQQQQQFDLAWAYILDNVFPCLKLSLSYFICTINRWIEGWKRKKNKKEEN